MIARDKAWKVLDKVGVVLVVALALVTIVAATARRAQAREMHPPDRAQFSRTAITAEMAAADVVVSNGAAGQMAAGDVVVSNGAAGQMAAGDVAVSNGAAGQMTAADVVVLSTAAADTDADIAALQTNGVFEDFAVTTNFAIAISSLSITGTEVIARTSPFLELSGHTSTTPATVAAPGGVGYRWFLFNADANTILLDAGSTINALGTNATGGVITLNRYDSVALIAHTAGKWQQTAGGYR